MADVPGPTPQQLGRHLQSLREAAGLTPEQLARRAGLPVDRVELIEGGTVPQDLEELSNYARALGIPLSEVFRQLENLN